MRGSTAPATPGASPVGPPSFHLLAKPTGAVCNLDCRYCFFLAKQELYPEGRFRMSDEVLDAYLGQLLDAHRTREVTVAWQGGEPTLMGVDFFRRAVAVAERRKRPGQRLVHTIQTNGTLLTDEWCELFRRHDFLVGISVDGPAPLHDRFRLDKRGGPTHAKVLDGLALLRAHGVDWNVLCTVNAANEDRGLDVYRYFRDDLGATFVQFIPIVERHHPTGVSDRSVTPAGWGRFLIEVFDEWVRGDVGSVFVSLFDAALASWAGMPQALCLFAETCGRAVALEHNGDLYACDHFVDPEHLLGNILDTPMATLVASDAQQRFGAAKADTLPRHCRSCEFRFACAGECPKNRFVPAPDGEAGLNYLCEGYHAFFAHIDGIMRRMADRLAAGGTAIEVMDQLNRAGRNEPCPCGSGRKAKACHQARRRTGEGSP